MASKSSRASGRSICNSTLTARTRHPAPRSTAASSVSGTRRPASVRFNTRGTGAQSSAIYYYGTNANGDIGSVWYASTPSLCHYVIIESITSRYAPSQGGSIFSPEASASGLAGLVAAAKVCGLVDRLKGIQLTQQCSTVLVDLRRCSSGVVVFISADFRCAEIYIGRLPVYLWTKPSLWI